MQTVKSQQSPEWFPVGAEWTYSNIDFASWYLPVDTTFSFKCIDETDIEGRNVKLLQNTENQDISQTLSGCIYPYTVFQDGEAKGQGVWYDQETDVVYGYINSEFKPLYDFSKKEGETYRMYGNFGKIYFYD